MAASARRYKSQLRSGKVVKHFLPSTTVHPQVLHGECFVNLRSRVLNHGHGHGGTEPCTRTTGRLCLGFLWAFSGLCGQKAVLVALMQALRIARHHPRQEHWLSVSYENISNDAKFAHDHETLQTCVTCICAYVPMRHMVQVVLLKAMATQCFVGVNNGCTLMVWKWPWLSHGHNLLKPS